MPSSGDDKRLAAKEVINILFEISTLLNTHLDRTSLSLCVSMIENGVNPEALAHVIKELRAHGEEGQGYDPNVPLSELDSSRKR